MQAAGSNLFARSAPVSRLHPTVGSFAGQMFIYHARGGDWMVAQCQIFPIRVRVCVCVHLWGPLRPDCQWS